MYLLSNAWRLALVTVALPLIPRAANAQENGLPPTLDCVEIIHAEAGDDLASYVSKHGDLKLSFAQQANGKYVMVGNLGVAELVNIGSNGFIQLIEQTPAGNMNLTTILTEAKSGSYEAVHSRHSIIMGEFVPSQHLLSCRAR